MTYVETPFRVGEALTGQTRSVPVGLADPGPDAATGRIDPAQARPVLRAGVEWSELTSARGAAYVLLRSPDDGAPVCFLRLTPSEWELAQLMDGTYTAARLVAEFARIAGRLSPEEVRRVVADLAGNRMLEESPAEGFHPAREPARRWPAGAVPGVLRGPRTAAGVDAFFSAAYRAGGRFLFTRAAAVAMSVVALAGLGVFIATWSRGSHAVFVAGGSYLLGAVVLLVANVLALACHELGRGLATKHAGRAVPAAGLLIHFGVPSVYVDTSDVWMAGRRARMIVTAAGPAAVLALAGAAQLVGLAVPALAGAAFKLAFVCFLHALFHLGPLLPLDGYHLLMDWLEIPHLRARALAWTGGRLRRRPRPFADLDPEGRLIALYGGLTVLWTAIAAAVAYRVWADRVSPLATRLWHDGAAARLLLAAVLLGLCAPVLYLAVARAVAELRRWRTRAAERRREADAPRRLTALRASELGGLPEPALAGLAARARWVHPATGRQLVTAGGSPAAVHVVVEGALQARRPGDPGGTIRHHVGPGGVVGLADALTGRTTALDWHTAGTTLLALPTAAVATIIGPIPGPTADARAEAEALFADTPALAGLADDERLALIASALPVDLDPGAPVLLPGPTHAVVVESGVIALADGVELRRGTLIGPVGDGDPGAVAQARTPVRLWVLPDAASLPPLVGSARQVAETRARLAASGAVPQARPGYPPLAAPPGPPDGVDRGPDHRFERRMWWLLGLAGVVALLLIGTSFLSGPAWAEMPGDRVLLTADRGEVTALVQGRQPVRLGPGDRRHLPRGTRIEVSAASTGRLTFRGGGAVLLCAGVRATITSLSTGDGGDPVPRGTLTVDDGRLLADTTSTSGAFAPPALLVRRAAGDVRNIGTAWYAVDPSTVTVATGEVLDGGSPVAPAGGDLSCGDGVPVAPPAGGPSATPAPAEPESPAPEPSEVTPSETTGPEDTPEDTPDATPDGTRTVTPTEDATGPAPGRTTIRPRPQAPTTRPTAKPPTARPPTTTPAPRPSQTPPKTPPKTSPGTTPPTDTPTTEPPTTEPPTASGGVDTGPSGAALVALGRLLHLGG